MLKSHMNLILPKSSPPFAESYCLYYLIRLISIAPRIQTYDDTVFADRFRYKLNVFGNRLLIELSRLLHADIAYQIDTVKTIAAFCRISTCLKDFIRFNSIACRVQTTRCTMMQFLLFDSDINWQCLGTDYWWGYLDSFVFILHMK